MFEDPDGDVRPRPGRACATFLLSACCLVLASCGGSGDGTPATSAEVPSAPVASVRQGPPPPGLAMTGRTTVVLNPSPESAAADSGGTVAILKDAGGTVSLVQRDGSVREVSPDGKLAVRPAGTAAAAQGELPPSMIVAVDSANTVHIVDPDACMARTIAPDGRVATTLLPAQRVDRPCEASTRTR